MYTNQIYLSKRRPTKQKPGSDSSTTLCSAFPHRQLRHTFLKVNAYFQFRHTFLKHLVNAYFQFRHTFLTFSQRILSVQAYFPLTFSQRILSYNISKILSNNIYKLLNLIPTYNISVVQLKAYIPTVFLLLKFNKYILLPICWQLINAYFQGAYR